MTNDQDYVERIRDAPPEASVAAVESARATSTLGWWLAAAVAICAVIGAIYMLSGARTSPANPLAAIDRSRVETKTDSAAHGVQLAAVHAAKLAQAATENRTRATESAAQSASADAAGQVAPSSEAAPPP
jgi:hypothetical protein